jgi:hypothetical protein
MANSGYIRSCSTRLEQMDSVMSAIIANPPIRATSIGRVMWDPRTCTCGVKGDTKRDHADGCEVQPVLDAGAIIRASSERRAVGESLRKLVNADAAQGAPLLDARTQIMVTPQHSPARQCHHPRRPSHRSHESTPRRRAAHGRTPQRQDAGRPLHRRGADTPADALAILKGDADVVEAEIVED